MRKIDIFTHISPPGFSEGVDRLAGTLKDIGKRSRGVPMLHDLNIRFRVMDTFPEYQQVLSVPTPPIELFAKPDDAVELARIANDSMADLVRKHPDRFVTFAAALPMNVPDAAAEETHRAVKELGAKAIQIHSNILGKPLVASEFLPIF
jgi:aminocarboxymuconate-semialdehyde decarboxylase